MLISAEHLSINFGSRQLLDDVDFYLNEGDKTGVIGINGTGKSTFLKVLAGKLQPDGGTIARKPNLQVSVLAQNPDMRDELTVLEQVFASMPPEFRQLNEYEAKRMLTQLGLADTDRRIGTLSGGERRRAALCAALIHPADVLVLDEPSAGLDPRGREELLAHIRAYHKERGNTVVLVSHSMDEIAQNVDRIAVLSDAHVLMSGTPREVFARADELVAAGLDVPQVTRVAMALRAKGLPIDPAVYTVAELKAALLALRKGGAVC